MLRGHQHEAERAEDEPTCGECAPGDKECERLHIHNAATGTCVSRASPLGKIIARSEARGGSPSVPPEPSFPAYADQLIRDQVSAITAALKENRAAIALESARVDKLMEALAELEGRHAAHREDTARHGETLARHAAVHEQVLGAEGRVRKEMRTMTTMHDGMARVSASGETARAAARRAADEALNSQVEIGKAAQLVQDSVETLRGSIEELRSKQQESSSEHQRSIEDLRQRQASFGNERAEIAQEIAALHKQLAEAENKSRAMIDEMSRQTVEKLRAAEAAAAASAHSAAVELAESLTNAKAAMDQAQQVAGEATATALEAAENLRNVERDATESVEKAVVAIQSEIKRVKTEAGEMHDEEVAHVSELAQRVLEVEEQMKDAAAGIEAQVGAALAQAANLEEIASTRAVEERQEEGFAFSALEQHPQPHHQPHEYPAPVDPESAVLVERATDDAQRLHRDALRAQETLESERAALLQEQRQADVDYATAQSLRHEGEQAARSVDSALHELNVLNSRLVKQEAAATRNPNNEQLVAALEATQQMIEQVAEDAHHNKEKADQLAEEYAIAAEKVERESLQLEKDGRLLKSDETAAHVLEQEGHDADGSLREAAALVAPHDHVVGSHGAPLAFFGSPPSPRAHAAWTPTTAVERYLGHPLPHDSVDGSYRQPLFGGGARALSEAQKCACEGFAMKALVKRGIKPQSQGYKLVMAHVREQMDEHGVCVQVTNDVITRLIEKVA